VRGTLAPVLDEYGVTFRVMHGYGSATTIHEVAEQSTYGHQVWVVLYVGDWDPSGLHMSEVDLPERLARYGGDTIQIHRVALTFDQVLGTGLPWFSVEDKRGDARYAWYRQRCPIPRCWELDALSPVTLRREMEAAILERIDRTAWQWAAVAARAERESLATILDAWPGISGQASE